MTVTDRVALYLVGLSYGVKIPDVSTIPILPNQVTDSSNLTNCLKYLYERAEEHAVRDSLKHFEIHREHISMVRISVIYFYFNVSYNILIIISYRLLHTIYKS